jgi:DNA-binding NarL/FixJ family response regulator
MKPKILVVDDHEIVREGIRTLLARSRSDWEICGEASNAAEALQAVKNLQPDIIILDITMPGTSGLEVAQRLKSMGMPSRILIFTMHESEWLATEVRDVGAQGYVLKSQAARDLVVAIERILAGGTFFGTTPEPQTEERRELNSGGDPNTGPLHRQRLSFSEG